MASVTRAAEVDSSTFAVTQDEGARQMAAPARARAERRIEALALPEWAWAMLLIGAFALYYAVPGLPLSLLMLVACAVLCLAQAPLAVSLVPLAMPFYMWPKHLGHAEFSLGETAIVLCAAAYVARQVMHMQPADDRTRATRAGRAGLLRRLAPASPLEGAIALFVVAASLATLFAHFRHLALRQYRLDIVEPIVFYVLAVALLRETRTMTRALWAVIGAGTLVALLGIGQYLFRYDTLTGATWVGNTPQLLHQVTSVYGSPNNLGLLLDRAIPVAVIVGLGTVAAARSGQGHNRHEGHDGHAHAQAQEPSRVVAAYLPWLAVVPMAAALVMSGSRGGLITAAAVSVLAALLWYGRRDRRLELIGLATVIAGAAAVLWKVRHGLSASTRINVWTSALHMIRDHPIFGVGPDNFLYYYFNHSIAFDPRNPIKTDCLPPGSPALNVKHYMLAQAWREPCLSHPHNVVLDAWLSTGILGLVALAALLAGFALLTIRNLRRFPSPSGHARTIVVACLAIVAATLAHGMVDNSIFLPDLAVDFWLALALTCGVALHGQQLITEPPKRIE